MKPSTKFTRAAPKIPELIQCVPQKGFETADCGQREISMHVSLCKQTADPNPFRGIHCSYVKNYII